MTLDASGLAVGLPDGLMGNSEVGHLNIGAGRVIYQDIVRINLDVKSKQIFNNEYFVEACNRAKTTSSGRLHLLGLIRLVKLRNFLDWFFKLLSFFTN